MTVFGENSTHNGWVAIANFIGSGRDKAVPLKQFAGQVGRAAIGGLTAGGGIGYMVQIYYGIQSGQVLWYLFELDLEEMR